MISEIKVYSVRLNLKGNDITFRVTRLPNKYELSWMLEQESKNEPKHKEYLDNVQIMLNHVTFPLTPPDTFGKATYSYVEVAGTRIGQVIVSFETAFAMPESAPDKSDIDTDLMEEIRAMLNRASRENESNTPDFILAESMLQYLSILETTIKLRDNFYGISPRPGEGHILVSERRVSG